MDYGGETEIVAVVQTAMDAMQVLGATLIDTDTGDPFEWVISEYIVMDYEFKAQIAEYLATLSHTRMRTLADLISFNQEHCTQEMKYFGQEVFEEAEVTSGNLNDPAYLTARQLCVQLAGVEGIDAALARDNLDAIIAPSYTYASMPAATAGYPNIAVPVGLRPDGKPAGIWMYSGAWGEAKLLALAYDLEQALSPRQQPQFLGAPLPEPPDAGICASLPKTNQGEPGVPHWPRRNLGGGKPVAGCVFCR